MEGHMQGGHRRRTRQAQDHPSLPQCTGLQTPRHQPNKRISGQVLLVAAASQGCTRICQRMHPMSTKQSKYTSPEGASKSDHTNNRGTTIPNHIYGLHRKITRIGRIRFHPDYHGPQLHKNTNCDTLQGDDNGWRSSWTILTTNFPQIRTAIQDHQRQGPQIHIEVHERTMSPYGDNSKRIHSLSPPNRWTIRKIQSVARTILTFLGGPPTNELASLSTFSWICTQLLEKRGNRAIPIRNPYGV